MIAIYLKKKLFETQIKSKVFGVTSVLQHILYKYYSQIGTDKLALFK